MKPFPGTLTRRGVLIHYTTKTGKASYYLSDKYVLTDEQLEWLFRWFPEVENTRLMKASGMSHGTLHRFAREFGLTKSEKGLRGIKRRQAAHVKKTCEANGYYDSLRGKPVSEACRLGAEKMLQERREGLVPSPMQLLKQKDPRRYKKVCKQRSILRKEMIRKEQYRAKHYLPRKTKLKIIVAQPYRRSQLARRYNALKRGYIIMQDCSEEGGERYNIYYDDDTERSERFENNLKNDGFRVMQYPYE